MEMGGPRLGDVFGDAFLAQSEQDEDLGCLMVERDDGFISCDPISTYFSGWTDLEAAGRRHIGHRVLDVGAGAGRHSLELQERGHDVVALDTSAGALKVCRRRGVRQTFHGTVADFAATGPERFDTILLFGHNLGLIGSPEASGDFLGHLASLCRTESRLVGTNRDPHRTDDPFHLRYHEQNRARGRMVGQLRLRVRWRDIATEWFDLLFCSPNELIAIVRDHGCRVVDRAIDGPSYLAVLEPPAPAA